MSLEPRENAVTTRTGSDNRENGMSLVELLVYILLTAILMVVISSLLIMVMRTSNQVTLTSNSSNAGQDVMQKLEIAIRNGRVVSITDTSAGELLLAEVRSTKDSRDEADTSRCVGILFNKADGKVHAVSDPAFAGARTKDAQASAAAAKNWPVISDSLSKTAPERILSKAQGSVTVNFSMLRGAQEEPVKLASDIQMLSLGSSTGACF